MSRQARWQSWHRFLGLCVSCSEPSPEMHTDAEWAAIRVDRDQLQALQKRVEELERAAWPVR